MQALIILEVLSHKTNYQIESLLYAISLYYLKNNKKSILYLKILHFMNMNIYIHIVFFEIFS